MSLVAIIYFLRYMEKENGLMVWTANQKKMRILFKNNTTNYKYKIKREFQNF